MFEGPYAQIRESKLVGGQSEVQEDPKYPDLQRCVQEEQAGAKNAAEVSRGEVRKVVCAELLALAVTQVRAVDRER